MRSPPTTHGTANDLANGIGRMGLRNSPERVGNTEAHPRNLRVEMDGAGEGEAKEEAEAVEEEEGKSEVQLLREENEQLKADIAALQDKSYFVPINIDLLEHNAAFRKATPRLCKPFLSAAEVKAFEAMLRPLWERCLSWPGPKRAKVQYRRGDDGTNDYDTDDSEISENFGETEGAVTDDMYEGYGDGLDVDPDTFNWEDEELATQLRRQLAIAAADVS